MRGYGLIGVLLLLPLKAMAGPLLFDYDNLDTAALEAPLQAGLLADGQRVVRLDTLALLEEGRLNLPDGTKLNLETLLLEQENAGDWVWHGRIRDSAGQAGTATFTISGQRAAGLFSLGQRHFELVSIGPARHVLLEFDPAARLATHPPSGPAVPEFEAEDEFDKPLSLPDGTIRSDDDESHVIDILALYTQEALDESDSEQGLRLRIRNAVNATNTAYINSGVAQRVRLVAQSPSDFDEQDMTDDLHVLRNNRFAAALRDRHAADLVALFGHYADDNYCGYAYIKTGLEGSWDTFGFSINSHRCLHMQILAHELGHNMGLAHDPAHTPREPEELVQPDAYGHRVDGEFSTIMSYQDGCSHCPMISHFSNPEINTSEGTPTGISNERDNARVLDYTAEWVAAYREPISSLGEALNAPELEWTTGGGGLWFTQDEVTRDGKPVPASGPVIGEERTWLATNLDEPVTLSIDWQTRLADQHEVALEVLVNGELVESLRNEDEDWQQASMVIEALEPEVRFQLRAPDEAGFDSIGIVYITNVNFHTVEFLGGKVRNLVGQGLIDVDVTYQAVDGHNESRISASDGSFVIPLPTDKLDEDDRLTFQGQGLVRSERPAVDCHDGGTICETVLEGEARTVSGTVSGGAPNKRFDIALKYRDADGVRQTFSSQEVTTNANGNASFQLDADSSVHFERVMAQLPGYSGRSHTPEDGINLRSGDLEGVELSMRALAPRFSSLETVDSGDDHFVASAMLHTFGSDQEVTLQYGKSSRGQYTSKTVEGHPDGASEVIFKISAADCDSAYTWQMHAVSSNGKKSSSPTRSTRTTACPRETSNGSSTFGCSLSQGDGRWDPSFGLLFMLALLGLMSRGRIKQSNWLRATQTPSPAEAR